MFRWVYDAMNNVELSWANGKTRSVVQQNTITSFSSLQDRAKTENLDRYSVKNTVLAAMYSKVGD